MGVNFLKSHFKCITFGLMPLADNLFKQYAESIPGARDCFCHIVQKNDIIPKLFGALNMSNIQVCFNSFFVLNFAPVYEIMHALSLHRLNYNFSI